jgi:hypothetical protein
MAIIPPEGDSNGGHEYRQAQEQRRTDLKLKAGQEIAVKHDPKFAAQQQIGARLFYAVSAVKLVDEAALIEFLNRFYVN